MVIEKVVWTFYGYVTHGGRKDVQEWFDGLSIEEREAAMDTLAYLQHQPLQAWRMPDFEPLDKGLSEFRFKVNALHAKGIHRIYGVFWPAGKRYSYTFLLAKGKKVGNDKRGKREALDRLRKLEREEASVHVFEFEERIDPTPTPGETGPPWVC